MEATLHALGNLLLGSIPTMVSFLFLYFFLQYTFFRPVARVLAQRRQATEGVRELSERAFAEADRKQSEFERAVQLARQEISKENDAVRQQWAAEAAEVVAQARADAERKRGEARAQVAAELEQAHRGMEDQIDRIATSIVDSLLRRRAA